MIHMPLWNVKSKNQTTPFQDNTAILSWTYPKKEKRQRNSNESIRRGQEVPHPLTLIHQSVAKKTSLVKELTNPLKLPAFPTIWYKHRSPPSLGALFAWPLGCVKGVTAPACNKVPHCFCIDPRLLWCLVGFCHPGTTFLDNNGFSARRSNPSKGNESWIFIGRTDAEAETPIVWPSEGKN